MDFIEVSEGFPEEEKSRVSSSSSLNPLTKRDRIREIASVLVDDRQGPGRPNTKNTLEQKLAKTSTSFDEYVEFCAEGGLTDEIIRQSVMKYLLPNFPTICKVLGEQAKTGDDASVKQSVKLIAQLSTLLNQYTPKGSQHLHLHYAKMGDEELMEEGRYQVRKLLEMQLQLPGGGEIVQQLFEELLASNPKKLRRV